MSHMLVVILQDLNLLPSLLARWREVGVTGVTIQRTMGGFHVTSWLERVGLGMLGRAFDSGEAHQRMLFSIIDDEGLLEKAIAAAESIVGGFDRPHSGLLYVIPVTRALGLKKHHGQTAEELIASAAPPRPVNEWERMRALPVERLLSILELKPTTVGPDDSLPEVAAKLLEHPETHVACVVNEEGRLVGVIRLETVASALYAQVMPEEFLQDMSDLQQALDYASHLKQRTARDAMEEPASVRPTDPIRAAFKEMHEHRLSGIPVVDDTNHIVGYINLLEILALVARMGKGGPERPGGQERTSA